GDSRFVCNAMFFADRIDLAAHLLANATRFLQALLVRAAEFRKLVERPVQPGSDSWKNRATFSFGFATHRHHELEYLSRLPNIENAPRRILRDIDSEFAKCLHNQWIDRAGF